jgi:UDP-glucose 4-epimerase
VKMDDFFTAKTVLVTGGAGFIGSRLVRHLVQRHCTVVVLDDLSSGSAQNLEGVDCRFIQGSVEDKSKLDPAFSYRPRLIFHLAALFAHQNSVEHPERDLLVNGFGTLHLLTHAADHGVDRVVYTSSSCVYGEEAVLPHREPEASLHPKTPYQATKLLGEMYTNCFRFLRALPAVNVRLFNVYGPGERLGNYRNVIPRYIVSALAGFPLEVHGRGNQTRDFTYVDDVVTGLCLCAENPAAIGETLNLGSGREVSIRTLAEAIIELTGSRSEIVARPFRSWDRVQRRCADLTLSRRVLGFDPRWDLRSGLKQTIVWFKNCKEHWVRQ